MEFKCLVSEFDSNCYLIYNENDVYIIDPSCEIGYIKKYLKEEDKVKGILITHSHIDHIYYLEKTQKYFACKVYMHKKGLEFLNDSYKNCSKLFGLDKTFIIDNIIFINDNDLIDGFIKVIYTPGHTIDSICFAIEDNLFTGDTLFNNSVGRTDFYSGNLKTLSDSVKKIYSKEINYNIYPGHGESSNLDNQLLSNYYVRKMMGAKNPF